MVLARSRERKAKWLQLEDFGSVVERGRRDGMLITFVPIYDLSPEQSDFATGKVWVSCVCHNFMNVLKRRDDISSAICWLECISMTTSVMSLFR